MAPARVPARVHPRWLNFINPLSHIIILAKLYAKYDVSIVFAKYIGPNQMHVRKRMAAYLCHILFFYVPP